MCRLLGMDELDSSVLEYCGIDYFRPDPVGSVFGIGIQIGNRDDPAGLYSVLLCNSRHLT